MAIKSKKAPRLKAATLKSAITHLLALWLLVACAGSGGSGDYSQSAPVAPAGLQAVPGQCIYSLHTLQLYKIRAIKDNGDLRVLKYHCSQNRCRYRNFRQTIPSQDLISYRNTGCL